MEQCPAGVAEEVEPWTSSRPLMEAEEGLALQLRELSSSPSMAAEVAEVEVLQLSSWPLMEVVGVEVLQPSFLPLTEAAVVGVAVEQLFPLSFSSSKEAAAEVEVPRTL